MEFSADQLYRAEAFLRKAAEQVDAVTEDVFVFVHKTLDDFGVKVDEAIVLLNDKANELHDQAKDAENKEAEDFVKDFQQASEAAEAEDSPFDDVRNTGSSKGPHLKFDAQNVTGAAEAVNRILRDFNGARAKHAAGEASAKKPGFTFDDAVAFADKVYREVQLAREEKNKNE